MSLKIRSLKIKNLQRKIGRRSMIFKISLRMNQKMNSPGSRNFKRKIRKKLPKMMMKKKNLKM